MVQEMHSAYTIIFIVNYSYEKSFFCCCLGFFVGLVSEHKVVLRLTLKKQRRNTESEFVYHTQGIVPL